MQWIDYLEQVEEDAREYMEENFEESNWEDWEEVEDDLMLADSVTGNGSGSYTFCTYEAVNNVTGIIFDDEVVGLFREYGYDGIPTEMGAEACDVIARCIALYQIAYKLEDYFEELRK